MSIIKTPEDEFIQDLEGYLDIKFDKYSESRILTYLNDYKSKFPPKIIVKRGYSDRIKYKYIDTSLLKICTEEQLVKEAKEICEKYNIDYSRFVKSASGKSTSGVTDIRKIFCRYMLSTYRITRRQLQDFFSVDHSTLIYYINDNYKPNKKKTA